jgi:hypothetical protein
MSSGLENSESIESTLGLRPDQLADLFSVAIDDRAPVGEAGAEEESVGQILRHRLATPSPGDSDPTSLPGRSVLEVLLDPKSTVNELEVIKAKNKSQTVAPLSEGQGAAATTLYYGAIASALVHHRKKITQGSYQKLEESLALLGEKTWMVEELRELLSQARRICQSRRDEK